MDLLRGHQPEIRVALLERDLELRRVEEPEEVDEGTARGAERVELHIARGDGRPHADLGRAGGHPVVPPHPRVQEHRERSEQHLDAGPGR